MRNWLTSALLRRILIALLIVSLAPLAGVAYIALQSYQTTRTEVISQSTEGLDSTALEGLEARTATLAENVAAFLDERENDLLVLANLPREEDVYLGFAQARQAEIWTVDAEGTEIRFPLPVYREAAFINADGEEVIKISNNCEDYPFECSMEASKALADISNPANTLLHSETYFAEAAALSEGQVYVGPVLSQYTPYEEAYAGAQNRSGRRSRGVMRFAIPVYDGARFEGVVVLGLETLHLIEQVGHVAPASTQLQAEIDPREADFAYMIDPDGWAVSHPRHFNIAGVDENGDLVPAINEASRDDPNNLFRPGNFNQMGFIDPIFPTLMEYNKRGVVSTTRAAPLGREARVLSYATIPYNTGRYNTNAGFGLVVLSTDGARFSLPAELLGKQIGNRISELTQRLQYIAGASLFAAVVLAIVLARGIAFPILGLTRTAQHVEEGNWEAANIDELSEKKGSDEISRLARVFASMAKELRARETALKQRVRELEIAIDAKKVAQQVEEITDNEFFRDLTAKARQMRSRGTSGEAVTEGKVEESPSDTQEAG